MKTIIKALILSLSFLFTSFKSQNKIFKIEFINHKTEIDTVKSSAKIDLNFIRENLTEFINISNFPKKMVDKKFKNEVNIVWDKDNEEKNYKKNSSAKSIYDNKSRIIEYEYRGCSICSCIRNEYVIKIKYDNKNNPIELIQTLPFMINVRKNEVFTYQYNIVYKNSDIEKLTIARNGEEIQRITLLN